ncbi:MAG TPA: carbonic anhydrase [Deinococcales bacterium]|nr:carbonic anhydrase [Deinococcales bacterium]
MPEIVPVRTHEEIPPEYRDTPVGRLLEYHNLGRECEPHERAEIVLGMCMDNRTDLHLPRNFAFVLRTSGANMRHNEFRLSYAIAVGGVRHIALVAHTDCGMVNLESRHRQFVQGMMENAGWDEERAEEHFLTYAPEFGIDDEVGFVLAEAQRLNLRYPRVSVAPLLYRVEDKLLYALHAD